MKEVPQPSSQLSFLERYLAPVASWIEGSRLRIAQYKFRRLGIEEVSGSMRSESRFKRGSIHGAKKEGSYSGWVAEDLSADEELLEDLQDLRARSRDLITNDSIAAGLKELWISNVIGNGLRPQSRFRPEVVGLSPDAGEQFRRDAEELWREYSEQPEVSGLLNEMELQEQLFGEIFEAGECFTLPRRVEGLPFSVSCQVIEAARIDTPPDQKGKEFQVTNGNKKFRSGIEFDDFGRPIRYWIKSTHPGDSTSYKQNDYISVPYRSKQGRINVYHTFRRKKPNQSRGMPWLTPSLLAFKDLSQYTKALIVAEKVAACFAAFIYDDDPLGAAASARKPGSNPASETLRPGQIKYLPNGKKVEFGSPNRSSSSIDQIITKMLRSIGTPTMTPYELIGQDFSKTNYTSGRMSLTEFRRRVRSIQKWFALKTRQPYYELVLEEAVLQGRLKAPNFFKHKREYCRSAWIGQGWTWIDPTKETKAVIESLDKNITTLAKELGAHGEDWEEVLEQRFRELAREKELRSEHGIEVSSESEEGEDPDAEETEEEETEEQEQEEGNDEESED